ncbi:MAG: KH domain-containing protein [Acidimicrobiales bacterium]
MSDAHDDYVAGDVNTIDDDHEIDYNDVGNDVSDHDDHDDAGNVDMAVTATAALEFIAKSLAEDPAAVSVEVNERQGKVILSLSVGPNDMGRIIGRRGRTAQAIRALVGAAGARDGVTTSVDIVD